jgi:hypothetical protein
VGIFTGLFEIPEDQRGEVYWKEIYEKTYTRLSPYIFGMNAALSY